MVETMREAMDYCRDHAEAGDAVLLVAGLRLLGRVPELRSKRRCHSGNYVQKEILAKAEGSGGWPSALILFARGLCHRSCWYSG